MKKALVVTFGSVLAAGMMATASAHYNLAERQFFGHTSVWVEGNYMEPSNNGVSIGDQFGANLGVGLDLVREPKFIDFGSDWNYALGFAYHIPHSHSRFFFSYDHFVDGEDTTAFNIIDMDFNVTNIGPNTTMNAHAEHRYREFKAGFVHTLNASRRFHLDLSAFFAFDKLSRTIEEQLRLNNNATNHYRNTENRMDGWGPGLGVMARTSPFHCYPHIGFFAGGNSTLLWANNDYQQYEVYVNDLQDFYSPESSESVVGKLEISFGVDYARACHTDIGGLLFDISLGMRYMNMFNALKNGNTRFYNNEDLVATDFPVFLGPANDWGKMGPFIRFKVGGIHA